MNDQIEQVILEDLLEQIEHKRFANQSIFPSENKLAEMYNVSRIKIRHVLLKLEEMGYLYSQQGKGRFLKQRDQSIDLLLSGNVSFTEKMIQAGYTLETNNHSCEKVPYEPELYKKLNIEQSDEVFKISRLRMINGEPAVIHQSYVAKSIFPQKDLPFNPCFHTMRKKALLIFRVIEVIYAFCFRNKKRENCYNVHHLYHY